jgi:hypothetical protein
MAAIAIVLPILIWQLWGFLAPAVDEATQRTLRVFIVIGTGLFALVRRWSGGSRGGSWRGERPRVVRATGNTKKTRRRVTI